MATTTDATWALGAMFICLLVLHQTSKISESDQTSNREPRIVESNVAIIVSSMPGFAKFFKTYVSKTVSIDSRHHDGTRLESGGIPCERLPIGRRCGTFDLSSRANLRDAIDL